MPAYLGVPDALLKTGFSYLAPGRTAIITDTVLQMEFVALIIDICRQIPVGQDNKRTIKVVGQTDSRFCIGLSIDPVTFDVKRQFGYLLKCSAGVCASVQIIGSIVSPT